MGRSGLGRRTVVQALGAWALAGGAPPLGSLAGLALAQAAAQDQVVDGFAADTVKRLAQQLAQRPYSKPRIELPEPYNKLTYDQYRDIRFRADQAIWRGEALDYELQLFAMGYLYDVPVEIWIVVGSRARLLRADSTVFSIGPLVGSAPQAAPFGFSGFRIHGPLNRSDVLDEYVVFQGATYFRAVGRGQSYGLSARGLAINVAKPPGEEFPLFRGFWIEKPKKGAPELVVHALLDSPSTAGAYRMSIQPGAAVVMDIDATLFPRREMPHVGLAPLTSMFLHGPASRRVNGD
ncbi:MAG TPA: glucan biosynthesis protein, partial [Solirubrobacterales bacterium]|nr:glucan biosynthesis protein [Solirubrobacterales bacterium]